MVRSRSSLISIGSGRRSGRLASKDSFSFKEQESDRSISPIKHGRPRHARLETLRNEHLGSGLESGRSLRLRNKPTPNFKIGSDEEGEDGKDGSKSPASDKAWMDTNEGTSESEAGDEEGTLSLEGSDLDIGSRENSPTPRSRARRSNMPRRAAKVSIFFLNPLLKTQRETLNGLFPFPSVSSLSRLS